MEQIRPLAKERGRLSPVGWGRTLLAPVASLVIVAMVGCAGRRNDVARVEPPLATPVVTEAPRRGLFARFSRRPKPQPVTSPQAVVTLPTVGGVAVAASTNPVVPTVVVNAQSPVVGTFPAAPGVAQAGATFPAGMPAVAGTVPQPISTVQQVQFATPSTGSSFIPSGTAPVNMTVVPTSSGIPTAQPVGVPVMTPPVVQPVGMTGGGTGFGFLTESNLDGIGSLSPKSVAMPVYGPEGVSFPGSAPDPTGNAPQPATQPAPPSGPQGGVSPKTNPPNDPLVSPPKPPADKDLKISREDRKLPPPVSPVSMVPANSTATTLPTPKSPEPVSAPPPPRVLAVPSKPAAAVNTVASSSSAPNNNPFVPNVFRAPSANPSRSAPDNKKTPPN